MKVERALESFVRGFSFTRSFTHPYVPEQVRGIWKLADGPGCRDPRTTEWVAYHQPPEVVVGLAEQTAGRWALCAIADVGEEKHVAAAYKALGLRLRLSEPLFVSRTEFDPLPSASRAIRIETVDQAELIRVANRSRQILPEHLGIDDAPCRLYAVFERGVPIGWVRSIRTHSDAAWVSNLYVRSEHRRAGVGSDLMRTMLHDDARLGIEHSVLLASKSGSLLYPKLGYRQIATLLLMSPRERSEPNRPIPGKSAV